MSTRREPTTNAGRALAAWNRRSTSMAETIVRIEQQAVADWLVSPRLEARLRVALEAHVECGSDGAHYDVAAILAALR
jgi:hypothetical protein